MVARRHLLALSGFMLITAALFAPLISDIENGVLRGPTDGAQVIRHLWMLQETGMSPFQADWDPLVGAPEGSPLSPALDIAQPLQPGSTWILAHALGAGAAFNLFLLAGFMLTALATYALLSWLRLNSFAAFFGGVIVAFNPWMIERALEGHAAFVHLWPLILLIGALVALHETARPVVAALGGLGLGLSFLTASYTGLLASVVAVTFLVTTLVLRRGWAERLWVLSLASVLFGVALVFLVPAAVAYVSDRDSVDSVAAHSAEELGSVSVGATVAGYLRPSAEHPLFGSLGVQPRLGTENSELVLYLGFTTIALAGLGLGWWARRESSLGWERLRYALTGAVVLAPVAFLMSLPPRIEIAGLSFPLPSGVLAESTSFYRVYARFGILVFVAMALLAAAAVHVLLQRRRGIYIAVAATFLVGFELFPGSLSIYSPPERPSDRWLASQRHGILANYPMPTDQYPSLELAFREQFRQRFHGQPLFTVVGPGVGGTREEAIRLVTRYVSAPETPGLLRAEGIRYILLHDDVYRAQGEEPPPVPDGFRLVRSFGNIRALELQQDVAPADVDVLLEQQAATLAAVQGLSAPSVTLRTDTDSGPSSDGWYSITEAGSITLRWEDTRLRRVMLLIRAKGLASPQTLRILDDAGRVLAEGNVGAADTDLALGPIPVRGVEARWRLRTMPSPETRPALLIMRPVVQPLADFSVTLGTQP